MFDACRFEIVTLETLIADDFIGRARIFLAPSHGDNKKQEVDTLTTSGCECGEKLNRDFPRKQLQFNNIQLFTRQDNLFFHCINQLHF